MRHATLMALLAPLTLLAGAPRAQAPAAEALVVAYCQPGQGCEACRTAYTHAQAIDLGVLREFHDGGSLVVWGEAGGKWRSESVARATREGLVAQFGSTAAEGGVTFHPSCAARPPLPGAIQPRAGEWRISAESRGLEGCPASVRGVAESAAGEASERMAFPTPFLGEIPGVTPAMIQTGPNQFEGIAIAGEVHAWLVMRVRSADEIAVSISLVEQGKLDPACEAMVDQVFRRIGD